MIAATCIGGRRRAAPGRCSGKRKPSRLRVCAPPTTSDALAGTRARSVGCRPSPACRRAAICAAGKPLRESSPTRNLRAAAQRARARPRSAVGARSKRYSPARTATSLPRNRASSRKRRDVADDARAPRAGARLSETSSRAGTTTRVLAGGMRAVDDRSHTKATRRRRRADDRRARARCQSAIARASRLKRVAAPRRNVSRISAAAILSTDDLAALAAHTSAAISALRCLRRGQSLVNAMDLARKDACARSSTNASIVCAGDAALAAQARSDRPRRARRRRTIPGTRRSAASRSRRFVRSIVPTGRRSKPLGSATATPMRLLPTSSAMIDTVRELRTLARRLPPSDAAPSDAPARRRRPGRPAA